MLQVRKHKQGKGCHLSKTFGDRLLLAPVPTWHSPQADRGDSDDDDSAGGAAAMNCGLGYELGFLTVKHAANISAVCCGCRRQYLKTLLRLWVSMS
jgi:hypothetical protein